MNIWLINDHPVLLATLCSFLYDLGYTVISFETLEKFIEKTGRESRPADVVIIDLPVISSARSLILDKIHRKYPDISVIALTTQKPPIFPEEALKFNIHAFLCQPVRLFELEHILSRLCKKITYTAVQKTQHEFSDSEKV